MMMNGSPKHVYVEDVVHALADQRRRDLDLLRGHLEATGYSERHATAIPTTPLGGSVRQRNVAPTTVPLSPRTNGHASFFSTTRTCTTTTDEELPETRKAKTTAFLLSCVRATFLDVPLMVLFGLLVTTFCIQILLRDYYTPLFRASSRTLNDENLLKEFTYYERSCSSQDVTTRDLSSLLLTNNSTTQEAVDQMMLHGAALIPQILDPETVVKLRQFVVRRTDELTESEAYPVSQGFRRVSFGIDTTDDPIVPVALRQISTNPMLKNMLEGLLGDDPAVTEITALTAYHGCDEQAWHPDVKPDGNALKFARSYSHSFSFFVALQDTTGAMGATELCPGTHYCANDLEDMCERYGIQLNEAASDGLWHSGDGALLNQQVWHRGAKNTATTAPERILFIVSFIGRPQLETDPRQLARGTYFHMKWNMWGHTMQDLRDAHRSMAKPFSILRCLSLWKPPNRNWGYDLITSAVMRIANVQNGMEPEEVPTFIEEVIKGKLGLPAFLHGTVDTENVNAWHVFLTETVENCKRFLIAINGAIAGLYVFVVALLCMQTNSSTPMRGLWRRLILTHGLVALAGWSLLSRIETSEWGTSIQQGRTLSPPFGSTYPVDVSITTGPTTLPEPDDVLVGSRFDAAFLNAYNSWLDYHPGNRNMAALVEPSSVLSATIWNPLIAWILQQVGRVLQQDWRTGEWRVFYRSEATQFVRRELLLSRSPLKRAIDGDIAYLVSNYRFGDLRDTIMALYSQIMLRDLRRRLVSVGNDDTSHKDNERRVVQFRISRKASIGPREEDFGRQRHTYSAPKTLTAWKEGDRALVDFDNHGAFYRATVTSAKDGLHTVLYDDGSGQSSVPSHAIRPLVPLQEGTPVRVYSESLQAVHDAVVTRVGPDGSADIAFDDGSFVRDIGLADLAYGGL